MFDERSQYAPEDRKFIPIPQFMSGLPFYPLYFGEDPGHVTDEFDNDDYIDELKQ